MPRGRFKQTTRDAKLESIRRIEKALSQAPDGLRFGELRAQTGLHQDTLTTRLNALVKERKLQKIDRRYKLLEPGMDDLDRLQLLNLIETCSGLCVVKEGSAPDAAEDLIRKATVGYSFPGISPGALQGVMVVAHKYLMLHILGDLIRRGWINGPSLLDKPAENVELMRQGLNRSLPRKQVLAFTFDIHQITEHLQAKYLQELLRVASAEDHAHIENELTQYIKSYRGP